MASIPCKKREVAVARGVEGKGRGEKGEKALKNEGLGASGEAGHWVCDWEELAHRCLFSAVCRWVRARV